MDYELIMDWPVSFIGRQKKKMCIDYGLWIDYGLTVNGLSEKVIPIEWSKRIPYNIQNFNLF